jgi:hypothetical protein
MAQALAPDLKRKVDEIRAQRAGSSAVRQQLEVCPIVLPYSGVRRRVLMNRAQVSRIRSFGEISLVRNHQEEDGECRELDQLSATLIITSILGIDYSRISFETSKLDSYFPS